MEYGLRGNLDPFNITIVIIVLILNLIRASELIADFLTQRSAKNIKQSLEEANPKNITFRRGTSQHQPPRLTIRQTGFQRANPLKNLNLKMKLKQSIQLDVLESLGSDQKSKENPDKSLEGKSGPRDPEDAIQGKSSLDGKNQVLSSNITEDSEISDFLPNSPPKVMRMFVDKRVQPKSPRILILKERHVCSSRMELVELRRLQKGEEESSVHLEDLEDLQNFEKMQKLEQRLPVLPMNEKKALDSRRLLDTQLLQEFSKRSYRMEIVPQRSRFPRIDLNNNQKVKINPDPKIGGSIKSESGGEGE